MSSDSSYWPTMLIAIIVISTILKALVSSTKRALDYADRNEIKELLEEDENQKRTELIFSFLNKPSKYHYADHAMSILLTIIAFGAFNKLLCEYLSTAYLVLANLGFFILFTAGSDVLPKKLASQSSEKTAIKNLGFQRSIYYAMLPFTAVILWLSNIVLAILGKNRDVDDAYFSEEKVMSMLDKGQERGEFSEGGRKMIDGVFAFDDLLAYEIMTPRTDVFFIDIQDDKEKFIDELMEMTHSRIPVCDGDADNIIGMLHIKDYLLSASKNGFDGVNIKDLLRPVYFVPDTKNIDSLFYELQKEKQHIAVLIDEYGGFSGIVSIEDIIEEIVGDIDDEFDEEDRVIEKCDDTTYILDGNVYLDDLDEETDISLESDTSETIGGFIIDLMGEIPKANVKYQPITYENYKFTILSVKNRRIEKLKVEILEDE